MPNQFSVGNSTDQTNTGLYVEETLRTVEDQGENDDELLKALGLLVDESTSRGDHWMETSELDVESCSNGGENTGVLVEYDTFQKGKGDEVNRQSPITAKNSNKNDFSTQNMPSDNSGNAQTNYTTFTKSMSLDWTQALTLPEDDIPELTMSDTQEIEKSDVRKKMVMVAVDVTR